MLNAAERMRSLGRQPIDSGAPTSIFGSAAGLAQSIESDEEYRIGVYPILCAAMPEVAMGLLSCLCYLLEQFDDTRVYRCFARIDPADDSSEISRSDYQFSVGDWELEGLADNVTLAGALRGAAGGFELLLSLDGSLAGLEFEEDTLEYAFDSLADTVAGLPAVAADIYDVLAGTANTSAIIDYEMPDAETDELHRLLESVFGWNLDVYLYLWDVEWDEADIAAQFQEVIDLCQGSRSPFAFWCLGMLAGQVMQPGIAAAGEVVASGLSGAFPAEAYATPGAAAAAKGIASLGHAQQAVAFLQPRLRADTAASVWCAMIDIHLNSGQYSEAIDTCQLALENGLQHHALYWQYSQMLMAAEVNNWAVDEVLLIDPDEFSEEGQITAEIANALKLYANDQGDDLGGLQLALTYMIDAVDDELWIYFERLVQRDQEGEFTGEIVDRLIELEDRDRAYEILEAQLDSNAFAYIYLAELALADSDLGLAKELIAECRASFATIDDSLELELQRTTLQASLPSFDARYAEIKVVLSANRPVPADTVDMLEQAIELAPNLVDLHLLLSRCYRSWGDNDSGLEVLREAEERAGADPQIDLGIAQILWARGEREDAVTELNAALERFPSDISLLAQMASCLIENNQFEDARSYIARAESIAPSHRAIWQVRRLIAQKMAE